MKRRVLNDRDPASAPTRGADDNTSFAARMKAAVNELKSECFDVDSGRVDYAAMPSAPGYAALREAAAHLARFTPASLTTRAEQLAFWINLYNVLVIDGVIHLGVHDSVQEVRGFFRTIAYRIGGETYTPDDIEHGVLRGNARHPAKPVRQFRRGDGRRAFVITPMDARVHFALVCASRSCPPIGVYTPEQIDAQLDAAAANFINGGEAVLDAERRMLTCSRIFKWYGADFGGRHGVLDIIRRYHDETAVVQYLTDNAGTVKLKYKPYDWSLNR